MTEIPNDSNNQHSPEHQDVYVLSSLSHEITGRIGESHSDRTSGATIRSRWSSLDTTKEYELWSHVLDKSYTLDIKESTGSGLMRCTYGESVPIVITNPLDEYPDLNTAYEKHMVIQTALLAGPVPETPPWNSDTNKENELYWNMAGRLTVAHLLEHPIGWRFVERLDIARTTESLEKIYNKLEDLSLESGLYVNSHLLKRALSDEMHRRGLERRQPPAIQEPPENIS